MCVSGSIYWDYAITVSMDDIVYLHCHQLGKMIRINNVKIALSHFFISIWK